MDSHKYIKATVICLSKGENISTVITDNKISEEGLKMLKKAGVNIRVVKL